MKKIKLLFLLPLFSWLIIPLFCFGLLSAPIQTLAQEIPLPTDSGLPMPSNTSGAGPVVDVLITVMKWILTVFLILALISFVVTGLQYIFSFGGSIQNAKNNLMYSIIAVLVVGGALIIVTTIDALLSGGK
ncbi:MAG TPA: hypothetical protein GX706_03815 [Candidatus Moranbacteria bacterium]|nr:hypothetical protein [Candidatus Moranbacteria bacterium]